MKITKSDKLLGIFSVAFILITGYNLFGHEFANLIREFLKHIFI